MSNAKKDAPDIITHLLSRIPHEDLPQPTVELPKREGRGNYKEADYPFRIIPEVF
jgi:polyphosphate kinase